MVRRHQTPLSEWDQALGDGTLNDSRGDAWACARKPAYEARRGCAGMQVMDCASAPTRGLVVEAQSRPIGAPHRADAEGPLRYHQVGMLPERYP